ncbi:hypothetical protein C6499_13140 [Candidatus Poribacteria bacterium]|nr:MAG: hypothetical protein C6499_13140 [Candidatus Poribacteria bacterium]
MGTEQKEHDLSLPPADKVLFRKQMQRELDEIREEVTETCAVATEVEPIPESAYVETLSLLEQIPRNIPMPDMMWLEDGGVGLEWRPKEGIATMSLYRDNHVTFGAVWGKSCEIWGSCPLSDPVLLPNFLKMLSEVLQK